MHIICNDCGKNFNFSAVPRFCPFCGSSDVERRKKATCKNEYKKRDARKTALELIKRSNELTMELDALMEKYKPIYLERECMLNTLRVYKGRGIINELEMPKIKRHNIQKELAEYRKNRAILRQEEGEEKE